MLPFAGIVALPVPHDNKKVVCTALFDVLMQQPVHPGEILVVEDPMIQRLIDGILSRHGYPVTSLTMLQALEHVRHGGRFILITNIPTAFLDVAEAVSLLYIASLPDRQLAARFPRHRCLSKPFHPLDLVSAVRDLAGITVS